MLDMSVRAKILQLMLDLKARPRPDVRLHHARPGQREVLLRPRSRSCTSAGSSRSAPPSEIFDEPPAPVHAGAAPGDPRARPGRGGARATCRAARSPTRPSRRWAAPSTRAARRPSPRAAGRRATCGRCSRSAGLEPGEATYDAETGLVGDLDKLDKPELTAHVGAKDSQRTLALLNRIRAENPSEPFWSGVAGLAEDGGGVHVEFRHPTDPALRPAGKVDVACVLYPDEREKQLTQPLLPPLQSVHSSAMAAAAPAPAPPQCS